MIRSKSTHYICVPLTSKSVLKSVKITNQYNFYLYLGIEKIINHLNNYTMKKDLLVLLILLSSVAFLQAQVVENFEPIQMNVMYGGAEDSSTFTVVPNPDPTGINTSATVAKFKRDKDGVPWGGFWCPLPTPVDVTVNKYVHIKVWKPRISVIKFKLEGGAAGTLEIESMNAQTVTNGWEDIVFDFSSKTGTYPTIVFMPDYSDPVNLTEDIIIYFDDIVVNNDPTPNSAAAYVIESYEHIPLNLMLGGAEDLSTMTIVANPDPSGINTSANVCKFMRDKDGVPWGGFWSNLPMPVDVTDNKYVHVKVWKPRISPIKFKLEGGAAGTLETESMAPQATTGVWEDIVFDFTSKTGTYPIIALMPDFIDPVGLTEDMTIYFDDILINNDPNPIKLQTITMQIDMHGSGLLEGESVYISGSFGGVYGTWAEPGTNEANILKDLDNDSIYSIDMILDDGTYQFKFFKGTGWNGGEWGGDPNRKATIYGDVTLTYKWAVKPAVLTLNVDMHGSGLMAEEPVYVAGDFGFVYGVWNEPGTNPANMMTDVDEDSVYTLVLDLVPGTHNFKFFKGTGWNGGEWNGDPNRNITFTQDTTATYFWGVKPGTESISENPLAGKVSVFPVPFNHYIKVNTAVNLKSIVVHSTVGQQVAYIEKPVTGTYTINTAGFTTGLYFVTFRPETGVPYTVKIMKN